MPIAQSDLDKLYKFMRQRADGRRAPAPIYKHADKSAREHAERSAQGTAGGKFWSLGEHLVAAVRAATMREKPDARLLRALGLSESNPADGGFLLDEDLAEPILARAYEIGQILSRTMPVRISTGSGSARMPSIDELSRADGSRWGGVTSFWEDEGGSLDASAPAFRDLKLVPKKVTALVPVSNEVLEDVSVLGVFMEELIARELAFRTEDAIINGTGAGTPLGILRAPAKIVVAKEGSQTAATITYPNITAMWARLTAAGRATAVWLINQDVEPQLLALNEKLAAAGMSPIYVAEPGVRHILGCPVIPVEYCNTLGTEGDIILADLSQYVVADKPMQSVLSMHVLFVSSQSAFRVVWRVDGCPLWSAPLTPYKGTTTVSPFVTLETRA